MFMFLRKRRSQFTLKDFVSNDLVTAELLFVYLYMFVYEFMYKS